MVLALLAALSLAARAHSAPPAPSAPDDEPEWSTPPPSAPSAAGSFSTSDGIQFGQQLQRGALDQICRGIPLDGNFGYGVSNVGGVQASVKRDLRLLPPANKLVLLDSEQLAVELGRSFLLATERETNTQVAITLSGRVDGTSMVIRPLDDQRPCEELKRQLDLLDIKTVLPITAERLSKMRVGELWKIPATITMSQSLGAVTPTTYVAGSVSFGTGQTGSAMTTVYRMAPDKLRFRLRIDHVRVKNAGGQIVASIAADQLVTIPGQTLLIKSVEGLALHELARYLSAVMSYTRQSSDGQQIVIEFILNPNDPRDMEELAAVMRADAKAILRMAERMLALKVTPKKADEDFQSVVKDHENELGRAANAPSVDLYHSVNSAFALTLPFVIAHSHTSTRGDDDIVRLDDGGRYHLYRVEKQTSTGYLDVPIKGQLIKRSSLSSAQSFTYTDPSGKTTDPEGVYIRQEGFVRGGPDTIRAMADDVNGVMRYAGARGEPPNPALEVPAEGIGMGLKSPPLDERHFKDGQMIFTLVFNQEAIRRILAAPVDLVLRCYRNIKDQTGRGLFDWLVQRGAIAPDGRVRVDLDAFERDWGEDARSYLGRLRWMAREIGGLVQDLAAARAETSPEKRAQLVTALMSGSGKSGMDYEDVMKVLVQLADPLDLSAAFQFNARARQHEDKGIHTNLALRKDRPEDPLLKKAGEAKTRFARPSDLVD